MDSYMDTLISAVKKLPVACSSFADADAWVGIVLELEKLKTALVSDSDTAAEGTADGE